MNTSLQFAAGLGLGAAQLIFGYLGMIPGGLYLLVLILVLARGGRWVLAGALVGFGGILTGLVLTQFDRGGAATDSRLWLAVGAIPLVVGIGIVALSVLRIRHPSDERETDALT